MFLSDNIETTVFKRDVNISWHSYDAAGSISNLPTLFERGTKLCQSYFRKMHNADHKLNKLLPNLRNIPYGLRTHKPCQSHWPGLIGLYHLSFRGVLPIGSIRVIIVLL